jgi:hypothetical protein
VQLETRVQSARACARAHFQSLTKSYDELLSSIAFNFNLRHYDECTTLRWRVLELEEDARISPSPRLGPG